MDMQDREYEVDPRTSVPAWQRAVARIVLVTFTTGFVGCGGGAAQDAQPTTTVTAVEAVPTTLPPATLPPPPPQPPPSPPSTMPAQAPEQLSKEELRDLVAPVALYPDVVLSSLLPATTYPEQLHDAAEYVGQAEVVDRIPDDRGWDGSVIGLLQFPDVIRWLDGNPAWTDQMGQAVTYQQGDVLDAIQDYRRAVKNVGNLQSNQYQKVRSAPNEDIYIEPARPDVVYVPSYDPVIATQPQPAVVAESPGINPWIAFGGGAVVGALGAWALYSIFDDDDHDNNYYYGGGGGGYRRRIRGYDNYYYARGRRPGTVAWAPRNRQPYRRVDGWKEPRRLQYAAPTARPGKRAAALRPPTKRVGAPAPYATDLKRDQRNGNRQRGQNNQMQGTAPQLNQKQQRKQDKQLQQQQQREQQQQRKAQQGAGGGGKGKQGQGQQRNGSRQKSQQQQQRRQEQQPKRMDEPRQERRQEQQRQGDGQRERHNDQPRQQKQERMHDGGGQQKHGGGGGNGGGNKGGGGGGGGGGGNNKKKKNKQGND